MGKNKKNPVDYWYENFGVNHKFINNCFLLVNMTCT